MQQSFFHYYFRVSLFSLILFSTSCQKENRFDCFKSTGETIVEDRFTESFTGLDISDNINAFITQSSQSSLRVEAGKNIIENISTEVKDGILYLKNSNKCNWMRDYDRKVNVYISSDHINNITYRGFGEIKTVGTYTGKHFLVEMWMASGSIQLDLECESVYLKAHTGPADIICSGKADEVIVYMNGTGTIDARNLQAEHVLAINRDVGDAYVNAKKKLDAEIFSRGNIYYLGETEEINRIGDGSGKLIKYK